MGAFVTLFLLMAYAVEKQRHKSKRIFERPRDEHGFEGGITIVKDYTPAWHCRASVPPAASLAVRSRFPALATTPRPTATCHHTSIYIYKTCPEKCGNADTGLPPSRQTPALSASE